MARPRLVDDLADLVLGRQCVGCGRLATGVCARCVDGLRGTSIPVQRQGITTICVAATEYRDLSRDLILEYKERGYRSLARPLGWLLADAVFASIGQAGVSGCTLVPIPSHPRPARGFDALAAITREARVALGSAGIAVCVERILRRSSNQGPLKGLGRAARREQVSGAFSVVIRTAAPSIVIVDDVITTGATTAEAIAACTRAGVAVTAVAAIAVTTIPGR